MQIPILNGIRADQRGQLRTTYPRNLVPVPKASGISQGYLRPAEGIVQIGSGQGADRGGFNWNETCYRVSGSALVSVDAGGLVTALGDVGAGGLASFDNSFDRLAVASSGRLYLWNGSALTQVTDPDIGLVLDVIWVDGYFMTTDGTSLVVTELTDPTKVDPLKYGSSEADPDPVKRLLKIGREVYAVNRYSIEAFTNVGGPGFPFARIDGAIVPYGAISKTAACLFAGSIALLGGRRNEPPSIWLASNGAAANLSTAEVDTILKEYSLSELESVELEARVDMAHSFLLVHLPDRTLVYDAGASAALQEPVWHELGSALSGPGQYLARGLVWCYGQWIVGDPTGSRIGVLSDTTADHWGEAVGWEFGTLMLYNEGRGAIVHELELVGLPGRVNAGVDPTIWTSYSLDGETWSQERPISAGSQGQRSKRLVWRKQGPVRNYRVQRFRGTSAARMSFARLEAKLEPLNE